MLVEDGAVVATGAHDELMNDQRYARLWEATTASLKRGTHEEQGARA